MSVTLMFYSELYNSAHCREREKKRRQKKRKKKGGKKTQSKEKII